METELKVLSIIAENNKKVTQRELSAETNLSLSTINVIIKKMIEKGLIKVEKLNTRTMRYLLTPKGMMEKAIKTYDFIKRTYEDIMLVKSELAIIMQELPDKTTLYLYGEENEIYRTIVMLLAEVSRDHDIVYKKIEAADASNVRGTVIIWNEQDADKLVGSRCINILNRIV